MTEERESKTEPVDGTKPEVHSTMPTVVKVIEIIGTSPKSFDDAIASAVTVATKSLRGVSGADVKHMTVGVRDGAIAEYRVALKVAFAIEQDADDDDDD